MKTHFIARLLFCLPSFCSAQHIANGSGNYAVQLNEIMTSSTANRLLPKYEYIELFNRSDKAVDLGNWTITISKYSRTIPDYQLEAGDFVVLTTTTGADSLADFCQYKTIGIKSLPALLHGGTTVLLKDSEGHTISALTYKNAWFGNTEKAKGGWSLEQVDPNNPCGGENNWKPTTDLSGGTPGRINSVQGNNTDNHFPEISRLTVLNENTLRLFFSKSMDSSTIFPNSFTIDPIAEASSVTAVSSSFNTFDLIFENPFEYSRDYTLAIKGNLADCAGNRMPSTSYFHFGLPEICRPNDIVINEVLFDPNTGGASFVEIKNRSKKCIDLKDIRFEKTDPFQQTPRSSLALSPEGYLLFPDDYLVFTAKPASVLHEFPLSHTNRFLMVEKFPALNRSNGAIVLLNKKDEIVDSMMYSKSMHFSLLKSTKGVSLERVNSERPSLDSANWHSASEQSGFATPGYQNSEDLHPGQSNDLIHLDSEIFSPDQDGFEDILLIAFHAPALAGTCSILLFDAAGQLVRKLVKNELAPSQTVFIWDGLNEQHEKSGIGIYVIYSEFFDSTTGKTYTQKLKCILAGKLH